MRADCKECHGPMPPRIRGCRREFCSETCCSAFWSRETEKRRKESAPASRQIECWCCGQMFVQPRLGRPRITCYEPACVRERSIWTKQQEYLVGKPMPDWAVKKAEGRAA